MVILHRLHEFSLIIICLSSWKFVHGADNANDWGYPSGIIPLDKFGNKSYYFVHSFQANFLDAVQFCQDVHMRLVTVNNKEENNFLYKKVQEYNKADVYWSSATRLVDGNDYIWLSTGERLTYANWYQNQPDNKNDYCLRLWLRRNVDLQLDDTHCTAALYFICEREDNQVDQPKKISQNWENIFEDLSTSPDVKLFSYKDKSYYVNNYFDATYLEAVQFCGEVDMELLSIESEDENTVLHQQIRNTAAGNKFWSSGTRLIDNKNWYWLPTGNKVNYYNWQRDRPQLTTDRKCIQLNQDINNGLFWSDEGCNGKTAFICQTPTKRISTRNCPNAGNGCPVQPTNAPATVAPPTQQPPSVKEKTYNIETDKVTYQEAVQACQARSMQLVSIQNKAQNDAINTQLQQKDSTGSYWTSGNRIRTNDTWVWLNNDKISFFNWAQGEPNNVKQNEYCIEIYRATTDSLWNDNPCDTKNGYICETWVDPAGPGQCNSGPPVVNVYVNNNLVTCNGTVYDSKRISTTSGAKPGSGGVELNNNIVDSGAQTVAPVAASAKLPVKTKAHHTRHQHAQN